MGVDLAGDVRTAVVEALADELDVDAGTQRERSVLELHARPTLQSTSSRSDVSAERRHRLCVQQIKAVMT